MRPDLVVLLPPELDQDLRLLQRVEDLSVQQLIAQLPVEALDVPVLPRRTRLDEQRLYLDVLEPSMPLSRLKVRRATLKSRTCAAKENSAQRTRGA